MTIVLDHLDVQGKRNLIIITNSIGIFLSHVTLAGRIWAKLSSLGRLAREDYFMIAAICGSYAMIWANFYGMAHGLGNHEKNVSKPDLRQMNLSIWIIQRFQPPSIFCLKTSIILLYVRIFQTAKFKKFAFGIWIFTLIWMIEAWTASLFECWPINYFWDKRIKGGHCVPKPLTNVGFSNGFISFCGDLFILTMPIPMVWRLQMNTRAKVALTLVFAVGLFVVVTSIFRLIALFIIDPEDVCFTQVQAGVWTYLEVSIGITCGNLPLLRPLFKKYFDNVRSTGASKQSRSTPKGVSLNTIGSRPTNPKAYGNGGFQRMGNDVESLGDSQGSQVELQDRRYKGQGIEVKREVDLEVRGVESANGYDERTIGLADDGREHLANVTPVRTKVSGGMI